MMKRKRVAFIRMLLHTDNGFESTNQLSVKQARRLTVFEVTSQALRIILKKNQSYTLGCNGKVKPNDKGGHEAVLYPSK
jgi:hypothetical protein